MAAYQQSLLNLICVFSSVPASLLVTDVSVCFFVAFCFRPVNRHHQNVPDAAVFDSVCLFSFSSTFLTVYCTQHHKNEYVDDFWDVAPCSVVEVYRRFEGGLLPPSSIQSSPWWWKEQARLKRRQVPDLSEYTERNPRSVSLFQAINTPALEVGADPRLLFVPCIDTKCFRFPARGTF
jgi:hypothetical protein